MHQQQQAARAYHTVARRTASPRDLEASLLSRSAANLQRIREDWSLAETELRPALRLNRRLWNVFLNAATRQESPLPPAMRQNIASLGLFVLRHTMKVEVRPEPARLEILIAINRQIAAGLRSSAST